MAFGVGLGLKEGVGKASEYFAGYASFEFGMLPISQFQYSATVTIMISFQVHIGAKFVSGQFVCLCSDFQVLQSATYVSGEIYLSICLSQCYIFI